MFVLRLLKDQYQLGPEYGLTSFGVLLLQGILVVPLLFAIPIITGGKNIVGGALALSSVQTGVALGVIALFCKFILKPLFGFVSASSS